MASWSAAVTALEAGAATLLSLAASASGASCAVAPRDAVAQVADSSKQTLFLL